MSKKDQSTVVVAKFSLTRKIAEFLKLGNAGKLDSFFSRIVKNAKRDIEAYENNVGVEDFSYKRDLSKLTDSLEDAQEALAETYLAVNPEDVANNQAQVTYAKKYLSKIEDAKGQVAKVEDKMEDLKESYKDAVEAIESKIEALRDNVDVIGALNK